MAQAAAYCASKYALTGMLKSLALEYKRAGVRFSLLHLGGVNSNFWDSIQMRVQRERMLTIDAAARAVFFAASQEGEGVLQRDRASARVAPDVTGARRRHEKVRARGWHLKLSGRLNG